ncbi:MAG: SDR family oxidoreductase [Chitinophagaceae bacterium]
MFSIEGKNVVITGGGSGIGRAMAILFAKEAARVHIIDLNADSSKEVLDLIDREDGKAFGYPCDVSNQQQVLQVFKEIAHVDILINNAGIAHIGKADNTSEADFERIFNVNVKGAYNCLFAAIPMMKSTGGGCIINMASVAAIVGIPDRFAYSMSKGAIFAMTLSVAKDYLQDNIRCNSISPARVHTPFVDGFVARNYAGKEEEMLLKLSKSQPVGRMGKPEEVAALAFYLCSDEASFITGCDYPIDGGFIKLNN